MDPMSIIISEGIYNGNMPAGRPTNRVRTAFGERARAAREAIGLSQIDAARKVGISQSNYAYWERRPVALRPEQVEQLATILQVSTDYLFGHAPPTTRRSGSTGKIKITLDAVARLPRRQQQKILDVVNAFVAQYANEQRQIA
jgi:transcriptional regulator with XRE-family HTH domain